MTNSKLLQLLAFFVAIKASNAIDLELTHIVCDTGLPIYALQDNIQFSCEGNSRCSFGQTATIAGTLYYEGAINAGLNNQTFKGYAVGQLNLMTLHYLLFEEIPVKFCGDWLQNGNNNQNECPGDGAYSFTFDYGLPETHDFTTWFATGWSGIATLEVFNDKNQTIPLSYCELHFETFTTESEESGWATLPSAATASIFALAIIVFLGIVMCCIACAPRRKSGVSNEHLLGK